MTEQPRIDQLRTDHPSGSPAAALFAALGSGPIGPIAALVRSLARAGDVALLRSVLDQNLIDVARYGPAVPYAILPLPNHAHDRAAATALVSAWLARCKRVTVAERDAFLSECDDLDIVVQLLERGGRPCAHLAYGRTPLGGALAKGNRCGIAMMNHCLDHGELPVLSRSGKSETSLFAQLARSHDDLCKDGDPRKLRNRYCDLLDELERRPLSDATRAAIGAGLVEATSPRAGDVPRTRYLVSSGGADHADATARQMRLMALAQLSGPEWCNLLRQGQYDALDYPNWLALDDKMTTDQCRWRDAIIANLGRAGVVDQLLARHTPSMPTPGSMLHAAASADNAPVVIRLLAAGADPGRIVAINGRAFSAFDLAPTGSASEQALLAWRAKNSIARTLATARAPSAAHAST